VQPIYFIKSNSFSRLDYCHFCDQNTFRIVHIIFSSQIIKVDLTNNSC